MYSIFLYPFLLLTLSYSANSKISKKTDKALKPALKPMACGADYSQWQQNLANSYIAKNCPKGRSGYNNCCEIHDQCYNKKLGKKKCDDKFCACLEKVSKKSGCTNKVGSRFCWAVRIGGFPSYHL